MEKSKYRDLLLLAIANKKKKVFSKPTDLRSSVGVTLKKQTSPEST